MKKTALNKLKSNLPRGWQAKLQEKTKMSIPTISRVLNGKSTNNEVIKAALELIEEEKAAAAKLEEQINLLAIEV